MPRFLRVWTDKAPEDCTPDQIGTGRNLLPYQAKRDFTMTPEPKGKPGGGGRGNSFVVHEHHARHLHWDLRMEKDGVLKSWAVPKGVPEKAGEKHLAVATEDHPPEYLTFEGTIPEGEYGAGTEAIWDTGTYDTLHWDEGKIEVVFHGHRLSGKYTLVRFKRAGEKDWLIFKAGDEPRDKLHHPGRGIIPCREVRDMACSAGGPMEITILDVDEDDTKCTDCGKTFRKPKKKSRCPECGSENLSPL